MRGRRGLAPWVLCVATAGCAGASDPGPGLEPVFEQPEVATARERAPDLLAAAERARREARVAAQRGESEAADDHATRARLLVAAAVAESERLELEKKRLAVERRARALEQQARQQERKRERLAHTTRRLLAARVAREQARKAFAEAKAHETRRAGRGTAARQREAARVLRSRARLLVATARALGLAEDEAAPVEKHLTASERARSPRAALAAAEKAVRAALRALGEARQRADGPSAAEVRSLWSTASEMGLEVVRTERGTLLRPAEGRWSRVDRARLAALLEAHPHGPVRVEGRAPAGHRRAERRARVRAKRLEAALVREGLPRERSGVDVVPGDAGAPSVQVALVAYASPGEAGPDG